MKLLPESRRGEVSWICGNEWKDFREVAVLGPYLLAQAHGWWMLGGGRIRDHTLVSAGWTMETFTEIRGHDATYYFFKEDLLRKETINDFTESSQNNVSKSHTSFFYACSYIRLPKWFPILTCLLTPRIFLDLVCFCASRFISSAQILTPCLPLMNHFHAMTMLHL